MFSFCSIIWLQVWNSNCVGMKLRHWVWKSQGWIQWWKKAKDKQNKIQTAWTTRDKDFVSEFELNFSFFIFLTRFVKCRGGINFTQPVHRDKPPQMGHHYLWGSKQLNLAYSTIYGQYTGKSPLFPRSVNNGMGKRTCTRLCMDTISQLLYKPTMSNIFFACFDTWGIAIQVREISECNQ